MKVLKTPTQLFYQILELYTPKTEQQRRNQAFFSVLVAFLAAAALLYSYFS